MPKIKGIIFDMDGTLIDSESVYAEAIQKVAEDYHLPFSKEFYREVLGLSNDEFYQTSHEWFDKVSSPEMVDRFIKESSSYAHELLHAGYAPLKPGVIELLDYCERNQIKITVASNSDREVMDILLEIAGISHYFEKTFSVEDVEIGKPDPAIHYAALEYLGTNKTETLVIEDSFTGIQAANVADIPVIMIPDLVQAPTHLRLEAVLDSLMEVIIYIENKQ